MLAGSESRPSSLAFHFLIAWGRLQRTVEPTLQTQFVQNSSKTKYFLARVLTDRQDQSMEGVIHLSLFLLIPLSTSAITLISLLTGL